MIAAAPLLDADLNLIKKHLLSRADQTWQEWLDLAAKYKERGSYANFGGCVWHAKKLGAPAVAPVADPALDPEFRDYTDV
jgi:hypothetical protein